MNIEVKTEDWIKHLKSMTKFIEDRRKHVPQIDLAKNFKYIRIGGNGFRAVSIHKNNPCGSLYEGGRKLNAVKKWENAVKRGEMAQHSELGPRAKKPEHQLQAHLIHQVISEPGTFVSLIDCQDIFDQLLFVTDEFKVGNIRADLIFLGKKGNQYFPVFMELKVTRSLSRLTEQLEDISERMKQNAPEEFKSFLEASTGISSASINLDETRPVLVWPGSKSGTEDDRVAEARKNRKIITINFERNSNDEYSFKARM